MKNKILILFILFNLSLATFSIEEIQRANTQEISSDNSSYINEVSEEITTIREYRPQVLIELDEEIFSGTRNTIASLNKRYNIELDNYLESINYNSDLIFLLANEYFLLGRIDRANQIFLKDSNDLKNIFGAATTYRMMGNNLKAIEKYNQAISISSSFYESYLGRGLCYRNLKEYDKAISDFKKYIDNSKRLEGYLSLGDLYFAMGEYDEASKIVSSGLSIHPSSSELRKLMNSIAKNK